MTFQNPIEFILNVYKPVNLSSYDVVRKVKQILPGIKVGHGGTLDPFAEGVLLILIGKATKRMTELLKYRKSYEAILRLGSASATGDNTSGITETAAVPEINESVLKNLESQFSGEITQVPPAFSAKKINGKPAYKYARKGQKVILEPITVFISDLTLNMIDECSMSINVTCSSGTYIRVLGEDIARAIGTCGYLTSLKRTRIGEYKINDAIPVENLQSAISNLALTGV
ncbi:MAG: tRNA pseudouridine(55) synthase TruB [Candidatus Marinimicrobia bacterium]|nr:tRNA pseudouridine(55) synthase TruB [Candidatus Neomarinimicrobiota bacterium]